MVQVLLFDLDGVLFDGREFHKKIFLDTVNSISPYYITERFHDKHLDGLSTKQKIDMLILKKLLDSQQKDAVMKKKQELTAFQLGSFVKKNPALISIFESLSKQYRILCVSNSIFSTITQCLTGLGILPFFHGIISNEDCTQNKPSSQPYLLAFLRESVNPKQCLIFEDSMYGRTAAYNSGAWVSPVVDVYDLTAEKIAKSISNIEYKNMTEETVHINIVIPMAGLGSRFQKKGFKDPKPFIPVFEKPMIQWVIDNMKPKQEVYGIYEQQPPFTVTYHFIAQKSHLEQYNFDALCASLNINYTITPIDFVTEGAACTVLLAKDKINTEDPLVIANSDQFLEWDQNEFYRSLTNPTYDGCISVFEQKDPNDIKWSYSKLNEKGLVTEVAEKKYISPWATTGIYGWKKGSDFVTFAEQMISKKIRVNNEFYVCPVYNEAINSGKSIRNLLCKKIWGLGVPEDLEVFLNSYVDEFKT
jgi:beta-phosphoglucomutase-like phosphatase (HAD superfamily)